MNPAKKFLALPIQHRARAFEQTAVERAVNPIIIEKDFGYVGCWE